MGKVCGLHDEKGNECKNLIWKPEGRRPLRYY
jgi:hypothetical protein